MLISRPPVETCPGGGHLCLRIVSFWLSWARLLYCPTKPQGFRLCKEYLDEIESLIINGADARERQLAQQLFNDFARFPPADDGIETMGLVFRGQPCNNRAPSTPQSFPSPPDPPAPSPQSNAMDLKEQGNAAFAKGDFEGAEKLFSRAILADHCQEAYFANRSAARLALKRYKEALQAS